jgi:TolB-like protein/DNA-binding winged helix-turn-helix (wHTH) protein/Flp pilus assembly protein TadD
MDLLVYLAGHPGEVVTADELLDSVWQGVVVGTDSVYFVISQLRKALDDDKRAPVYIETIPKRGYRLIADVAFLSDEPDVIATPASPAPDTTGSQQIFTGSKLTATGSKLTATGSKLTATGSKLTATGSKLTATGSKLTATGVLTTLAGVALLMTAIGYQLRSAELESVAADSTDDSVAVAVMPFIDLSPEQDQGYFSDGVAEELRGYLARIPGLRIASREPSLLARSNDLETSDIGRRLGVSKLVEGSVRRDGERIRIAAQLVESASGFQLWSQTFEQPLVNILAVQDQIARSIADALQLELLEFPDPGDSTRDPQAYDLYLLGLQGMRSNSFASLRSAAEQLAQATRLDPDFTEAYAAGALVTHILYATGAETGNHMLDSAEQMARRALVLDAGSARAHVALGRIASIRGDGQTARSHLQEAVNLSPGNGEMLVELAKSLSYHGDVEGAASLFNRALLLDPLNPKVHSTYGAHLESLDQIEAAIASFKRAIALNPEDPNLHWFLSRAEAVRGNPAAAASALETAVALDPLDYEIAAHLAFAYASLEQHDSAMRWSQRAITLGPDSRLARAAEAVSLNARGQRPESLTLARTALQDDSLRESHAAGKILKALIASEDVDPAQIMCSQRQSRSDQRQIEFGFRELPDNRLADVGRQPQAL